MEDPYDTRDHHHHHAFPTTQQQQQQQGSFSNIQHGYSESMKRSQGHSYANMPPLPPAPWPFPGYQGSRLTDAPWPAPEDLGPIPPPPPGFRFHELYGSSSGDGHGGSSFIPPPPWALGHMPPPPPHVGTDGPHAASDGEAYFPRTGTAWPSPAEVYLPELFPFPPPFLPPPPFPQGMGVVPPPLPHPSLMEHHSSRSSQQHQGTPRGGWQEQQSLRPPHHHNNVRSHTQQQQQDDLPWLAPLDQSSRPPLDRAPPPSSSLHDAYRQAPYHRSSSAASYDEEERLKSLADQARRRFVAGTRGRSASQHSRDEDTTASDASGGPSRGLPPSRRVDGGGGLWTSSSQGVRSGTMKVVSDHRSFTSSRLTPNEQVMLKAQREARINARRNSVYNVASNPLSHTPKRTSSASRGGGGPPRYSNPTASSLNQHGARQDSPPSCHRHEDPLAALQQPLSNESSSSPPQQAAAKAISKNNTSAAPSSTRTPVRTTHTPQRAIRASRGVTLTNLKGDTPNLSKVLRDGLPSEQSRMNGFERGATPRGGAQQPSHAATNHSSLLYDASGSAHPPPRQQQTPGGASYIGFGASQYTPFTELAKKDKRAAEYLRGIETLYHNLRNSYEAFQKNPEQFLKGRPSADTIERVIAEAEQRNGQHSYGGSGNGSTMMQSPQTPQPKKGISTEAISPGGPAPPRLPLADALSPDRIATRAIHAVQPSAETRQLRDELDRIEHQWQALSELRSGEAGAGPVEDPLTNTRQATSSSTGVSVRATNAASPPQHQPSPSSYLMQSPQRQHHTWGTVPSIGPPGGFKDDVFSFQNVLGYVKERKQQHEAGMA